MDSDPNISIGETWGGKAPLSDGSTYYISKNGVGFYVHKETGKNGDCELAIKDEVAKVVKILLCRATANGIQDGRIVCTGCDVLSCQIRRIGIQPKPSYAT